MAIAFQSRQEQCIYNSGLCVCVVCVCTQSCPWATRAHQSTLSMEFSRQEYWNKNTPSEYLLYPGLKPESSVSFALVARFFTSRAPLEAYIYIRVCVCVCVCVIIPHK